MRSWFARRTVGAGPGDGPDQLEAYKDGRSDERRRVEADVGARPIDKSDLADAYERGRREERLRRRGSPLFTLLVLMLVLVGAGLIWLAVQNRSFSSGGAVVDRNLSAAAQSVQAPVRGAADKAGNALQNAGENLKEHAGSGKK